ncbi:OmpA family protein [Actibacterium ureilyticum]|uniref:OmpA family protein n=1 Tax=Actibacterium ureilyticum TaxID=1590614 RepID=UPI000BAAC6ED|nr:OmpA family protein [Actibacterium ureilyticum]
MKPRFFTVVALIGSMLPHLGAAQELSAEEMEALFKTQKTRGLVIATPSAPAETANTPEATAPTVQTGAASTTHIQLPKDEQVNIQISFDFDSAALRADQKPKLETLCQVMQGIDVQLFRIVGHTDAAGSADYNQRLSLLRAEEVKRHLVSDCGIAATRLEAVGVGEQFPFNEQNPRADENRRVEFQALS